MINWYAVAIMVMWLSAAAGAAVVKNSIPFLAALAATVAMCISGLG